MSSTAFPLFEDTEPLRVPDFRLKLGEKLAVEQRYEIVSLTFRDSVNEVDSFEFAVSNWDTQRGKPKYDPPSDRRYSTTFAPGTKVQLELGYRDDLRLLTRGVITALEGSWSDGPGTLIVRGLNELHGLRRVPHTRSWRDTTDSAIAEELGSKPVTEDAPGLGIEVRTSPRNEQSLPFVQMHNQYDIVFLLELARRNGYEVVLHEPDATSSKRYITFGPSDVTQPVHRLEFGKSLLSFRYTLDVSNQVGAVVVRGWDRRANGKAEGRAVWKDVVTDRAEQTRMGLVAPGFDKRTDIHVDQTARTKQEADDRARAELERRLKEMLQASGTTVGLPDLRAGRKIGIAGWSQRAPGDRPSGLPNLVEGEYYVTESTHTLGANGYRTDFRARREGKLV